MSLIERKSRSLILPGDLDFDYTIANMGLPPTFQEVSAKTNGDYALIVRPGTMGLIECVSTKEATEFTLGGEYDERLLEIPGDWEDDDVEYNWSA